MSCEVVTEDAYDQPNVAKEFSRNFCSGVSGSGRSWRVSASLRNDRAWKRDVEWQLGDFHLGHVWRRTFCRRSPHYLASCIGDARDRSAPAEPQHEVSADFGIWRRLYRRCLLHVQSTLAFGARATVP